jgi:transcriptional regulator with XRE-family HTH domain
MSTIFDKVRKPHDYSPLTIEAARILGAQVRMARRERRWTEAELAERVGVARPTIRKVEQGDPTVGLGPAFEAAAVLGVPLFHAEPARRALEAARIADRLAVLPERSRRPVTIDNDF